MTPKQETMKKICDLLHTDAQKKGMGLDYEMFSKRHMRMSHDFLKKALHNMENPTEVEMPQEVA